MRSNVGPMTKKVRNSASPIITWFGGADCVPSAWRSSDSTMTMRVKPVIISSTAGRKVSDVIRMSVWIVRPYWVPPPGAGPLVKAGMVGSAAAISGRASMASKTPPRRRSLLDIAIALVDRLFEPFGEIGRLQRVGCQRVAFLPGQGRQRVHPAGRGTDDDPLIAHFHHQDALARAHGQRANQAHR